MEDDLSGHTPAQILPVETYVSELLLTLKGYQCVSKLGNTRFFKVVHLKNAKGSNVVKILSIQEKTAKFIERTNTKVNEAKSKLSPVSNCLPVCQIHTTAKAVYYLRPFIKCSLYDRLSMMPYLTDMEKKWIAFQILTGLDKCHRYKICHGDLKLENILITSWSWVLISDFAVFKPVFLPVDDPLDFSFFFDSSRKTVCSIAPERFKAPKRLGEDSFPQVNEELTPEMDIFSAGCVLTALFTEGIHPFKLNGILRFRNGEYYPDAVLNLIQDEQIRNLIKSMISRNPEDRKTASDYLTQEKDCAFPLFFYTTLYPFAELVKNGGKRRSDEKIMLLEERYSKILEGFGIDENEDCVSKNKIAADGLVIIADMLTSFSKSLESSETKFTCLKLMKKICNHLPDEIILDRIIPCILCIIEKEAPTVKSVAIYTLTECLQLVKNVSEKNASIFPDFIFKCLCKITSNPDTIVRLAYADNISKLSHIAKRFLLSCNENGWCNDYEKEKELLQKLIQELVSCLFSDSSTEVKRKLVESSIEQLCKHFGKNYASDSILSHLVTYLNEKNDSQLRRSFFKSLMTVAMETEVYQPEVLEPLMAQGLADSDELVVVEAIHAMQIFGRHANFQRHHITSIIKHAAPMLLHPNFWIRSSAVGIISLLSGTLERLYLDAIIIPMLRSYLTKDICLVANEGVLYDALKPPIPRFIYDTLSKSKNLEEIFEVFKKAHSEKKNLEYYLDYYTKGGFLSASVLRLLVAADITNDMIGHILQMEHFTRLNALKLRGEQCIDLDQISGHGEIQEVALFSKEESLQITTLPLSGVHVTSEYSPGMNAEWNEMFGVPRVQPCVTRDITSHSIQPSALKDVVSIKLLSGNDIGYMNKKCLDYTFRQKRDRYIMKMRCKKAEQSAYSFDGPLNVTRFRPEGVLVAHLHEHKDFINRLVHLKGKSIYASCSNDGTVKLWDTSKIGRKFPVHKSIGTYSNQKGKIVSLSACVENEYLASGSITENSIHVFKYDRFSNSSVWKVEDDYATDMHFMESGHSSMLLYSTVKSGIIGLDLRKPGVALTLKQDRQVGPISSFVLDYSHNCLTLGTLYGIIVSWDLRFQLPISKIECPKEDCAVKRIKMVPQSRSEIICSMNKGHKLAFWNLESTSCYRTITAKKQGSSDGAFNGFHMGSTTIGDEFIITGGDDRKLRYWDIKNPSKSYCISEGFSYTPNTDTYTYMLKKKPDMDVVHEKTHSTDGNSTERAQILLPSVPTGHMDVISDVIVVSQPQPLVISSSLDGTIKLWK